MSVGVWVLIVAVVAALGFGLYRGATDGRFRGTRRLRGVAASPVPTEEPAAPGSVLAGTPWVDQLGERATLLQFSSAFCAPCRMARQILSGVAQADPTIAHVEVDAEQHLELVRRLGVMRTPTTLILDRHGAEVVRAAGAPTRQQVLSAVSSLD